MIPDLQIVGLVILVFVVMSPIYFLGLYLILTTKKVKKTDPCDRKTEPK